MKLRKILNELQFNNKTTGRQDWDDILKSDEYDFTQKIVKMSPSEFLVKVQYKRFTIDYDKVEVYYQQMIEYPNIKIPIPTMWFSSKFKFEKNYSPDWHDGTHRVLALQKMNIKKFPVKIIY